MKLLLTSGAISNKSINDALVDLLGKPIAECNALFIPTAIYPHAKGGIYSLQSILGRPKSPFTQLGWRSLGILELTALPSINKELWLADIKEADALLVWGGDPMYLAYWMQQSGLAEVLPSLLNKLVYVGVSAGSIAVASTFGETYTEPPGGSHNALTSQNIVFTTPEGEISKLFFTAHGLGLIDFALIPHYLNRNFPDASEANAEKWAAMIPASTVYAIDDQTAIKVVDGVVDIISEGQWKLFKN